jgi:hypothetical protein
MRGRLVVVGALLASAARASTPEAGLAFSIAYGAPAECPASTDFEQAVAARAPGTRSVAASEATLVFDAEVTKRAAEYSAVLWVTLPDGTRSRRDVTGETCAETLTTLAVIAALSLEGYRDARERGSEGAAGDAPDPPPLLPTAVEPGPKAATPVRAPAPTKADTGVRDEPPARSAKGFSPTPGVFVAGAWESAVAPSPPFGLLAGAELAFRGNGAWRPSVRLGLLYTLTASEEREGGRAELRLIAARLIACPVALGVPRSLLVHGCLELDAGVLEGRGLGPAVSSPNTRHMAWLGLGPGVRGEWPFADWLSLEANAGLRGLAQHNRFKFDPETIVHDVPPISAGFALGVAGRMP